MVRWLRQLILLITLHRSDLEHVLLSEFLIPFCLSLHIFDYILLLYQWTLRLKSVFSLLLCKGINLATVLFESTSVTEEPLYLSQALRLITFYWHSWATGFWLWQLLLNSWANCRSLIVNNRCQLACHLIIVFLAEGDVTAAKMVLLIHRPFCWTTILLLRVPARRLLIDVVNCSRVGSICGRILFS